ncbi:MAG TPA: GMC family oxidoreductase, partial [Acidimicrobiales bacterium]|nr:GMC family oxidoreductase [Acidimicrobiales bacterium]
VVVVGAGGGGGVVACVLAEAGARVLVVERGAAVVGPGHDHLRNHRTKAHGLGPTGGPTEPRVVDADGSVRVVDRPWDPAWHAGARVVGGGTRVYGGLAWRFLPDDFRMASRYGVPEGSSLADWPLTYDDLAPHYDWVEWEVGVCGDPAGHRAAGPRERGYPMPPLLDDLEGERLRAGAAALGLATGRVPLLLNSVPRDGRPACGTCGACVGLPCPTGGRNGTHDTMIPRALAAGATLATGIRATAVTTANGEVDGVNLVDEATGVPRHVRAGHVVVACGAIETARLLLASRSDDHPDGLGNATDQVGRHLQGHAFASAFGLFDDEVTAGPGPGATIATLDLAHGNVLDDGTALVGGGLVGNELRKLPIVHWQWALPPDAPRWGLAAKEAMRHTYRRTGHLFAQVQEVPVPGNRVTLDSDVRDRHGVPAARLAGAAHRETVRTAHHVAARAEAWMAASGAARTWIDRIPTGLLAGTHQAGTCRMGTDPAGSVVDPDGRVHGHRNLWVADASVHVTNGSVSPALTVMALARRTALRLLAG